MHTRNLILTIFTTLTAAMTMAVSLPVCSQEIANQDTLAAADSLAVDTIMNNDPEWYVAPMTHDLTRAPFRAPAAACPVDSVRTFNVDSVLESVSVYEYGDTTRTMIWTVNPDGSRYGSGREESATTANSTYTATYAWDNTTNDWAGTSRVEHYFVAGKDTAWLVYAWVDNAWVVNTKYTYVYDASGLETEYTTYQRNAAGQLVYAQRREKAYNGAGQIVLDVQYGSYVNGAWVGSTKYVYDYNASGTQTLYEYYSSCTNGVWNGSIRNVYDFDANGNKVLEEKYSGMTNGEWNGSSRYTASFNAGKEIEHVNYKWVSASKSWQENIKYAKTYDGENLTDDASYIWNNGWVGNARTTKTYSGSLVASEIVWEWNSTNSEWINKSKTETQYTGSRISVQAKSVWDGADWLNLSQLTNTYQSDLLTESYTRSWKEGDWQDSLRTINTYNAKKINTLSVSAAWNGTQWLSTDSTTRDVMYTTIAGKDYVVEDVTMTWSSKTNMWTGVKRDTKEYDAWGNVIQSDTYTYFSGTGWVNNVRRQYAYKNGNKNLETLNLYMTWNKTKGVWSGTTKTEKEYDDTNRLVKTSTYKWNTTHNDWEGLASTEDIYENGIKVTSYSYKWDAATWDWTGMFKHDYTYTSSGKIAEQIDWRYDAATGWYYDVKIANTYDAKGRTVKADRYQWIRTESQWCMTSTSKTAYDADADGGKLRSEIVATGSNCEIISYARKLYFYSCDPKLAFTIRFENEDGTLLESKEVVSGTVPTYDGETPTKDGNEQYSYTFKGWSPTPVPAVAHATYTAEYDSAVNRYRITWINVDNVEIDVDSLAYGATPSHDDVVKTNTAEWTYSFVGWEPAITSVTGDATYKAQIDSVRNSYRITWLNADDVEVAADSLAYGAMPSHEDLVKTNTAEWTYSFVGWEPAITSVTGDATYKAQIDSVRNSYRITWINVDNVEIDVDSLAYGATPSHDDVVKANTAEWTYSFVGWEPAITSVTGDATYKAQIDSVRNSYRITWLNADNVEIDVDSLAYGATPSHDDVVKANTAEWTYTFVGWEPAITSVTGDATYKAQIDSVRNSYLVTFKNGEDTLQSTLVVYGSMPEYTGNEPTKPSDAQYSYAFAGWDAELAEVTGEATYNATFSNTLNKYTITFKNGEETLQSEPVAYGTVPTYNGQTPTKPSDAQYSYVFAGWDAELVAVTGEATYTATFNSTVNKYLITFKNGDETLYSTEVEYGSVPAYEGATPTKPSDAQYSYAFAGWDAELAEVTGEATYNATFSNTLNKYTITFKNGDETLQSEPVAYGTVPTYNGQTPTKPSDVQYSYAFAGWDAELVAVTGEATYTATFSNTLNKYTITFKNGDETLQSEPVAYGTVPTYNGQTPTKPSDAQYSYAFAGWDVEPVAVTGEATYNATFTATLNSYTITWLNADGSLIETTSVSAGDTPAHADIYKESTAQYTYTFKGWTPAIVPANSDATYTAEWDSVVNKYTITFLFDDGITVMETVEVEYGQTPATTITPSKIAEKHYYYTFIGWTPAVEPVTGEAIYTAIFDTIPQEYLITFKNYNGMVLQETNVPYGTMPEYTGATPEKPRTQQYSYEFSGWNPELTEVAGATTYIAQFEAVLNQYTVVFLDEDGTELDRQVVDYGSMPVYQGETPVKAEDEQYTYTFAGWYPAVVTVTKDATYRATYTAHDKSQGLWGVQDGEASSTKIIRNGTLYILRAGKTYTTDGVMVEQ